MSKAQKAKYISVFIPVYNGEKYLAESIEAILNQELPKGYLLELLVTDSGSKDSSLEILKLYEEKIILNQIPNSEFGHGKTRQAAAKVAKGEFILFLSQDATPTDYRWVKNMIEPFYISNKVGCVFGRQIPRIYAVPSIKREVSSVFGQFGSTDSLTIHREKSLVDGHKMNVLNSFFSDVNSAARRDLLVNEVPFRDVRYAEDQALAVDMQNAGYLKAYSVSGSVWHSNEYTVKEFRKRKFDEYIALQESINYSLSPSIKSLVLGWIKPTFNDWKFILRDCEYSKKRKLLNVFLTIGYNFSSTLGKYQAAKYINNPNKRLEISLEESRKIK